MESEGDGLVGGRGEDRVRLEEKGGGDGVRGDTMSSWWFDIPDLGRAGGCSWCSSEIYSARLQLFAILLTVCVPQIIIG